MTVPSDLTDSLRDPAARVWAIDPTGGRTVDPPPELDIGTPAPEAGVNPLASIAPASHGQAVAAFETARSQGRGSSVVTLTDGELRCRLDIFDLEASHGCFVAVVVPDDHELDDVEDSVLAPRQATYRLDATGVFLSISDEFTKMLGWTADEVVGRSSLDVIHPDDHENGIVAWIEVLERPARQIRLHQRLATKSGSWLWCEVTDTNRLGDPDDPHVLSELLDVSRERAAHAALQRRETLLARLTQALPSGVLYLDADGDVEVWNDRWESLTGLPATQGLDGLLDSVIEVDNVVRAIDRARENGLDADLEVTFGTGSGDCRFGKLHVRPLRNGSVHSGLLVTLDDVTRLRTHQQELAEQTRRDPLTNAYNRLGIERAVELRLSAIRRSPAESLAVLYLDLDRFKLINDAHGHAIGDRVLRLVAETVGELLRPDDVLGRIGGDEFLVVLDGDVSPEACTAIARRIASSLEAISDRVPERVEVGVSVGVAIATIDDDFDSLIKRADEAMYETKRSRRGRRRRECVDGHDSPTG